MFANVIDSLKWPKISFINFILSTTLNLIKFSFNLWIVHHSHSFRFTISTKLNFKEIQNCVAKPLIVIFWFRFHKITSFASSQILFNIISSSAKWLVALHRYHKISAYRFLIAWIQLNVILWLKFRCESFAISFNIIFVISSCSCRNTIEENLFFSLLGLSISTRLLLFLTWTSSKS